MNNEQCSIKGTVQCTEYGKMKCTVLCAFHCRGGSSLYSILFSYNALEAGRMESFFSEIRPSQPATLVYFKVIMQDKM